MQNIHSEIPQYCLCVVHSFYIAEKYDVLQLYHFVYLFTCLWIFGLFPVLSC